MDLLLEHVGQGFIDMLLISMPIVFTAAGIGLVVGILQAVTQVQEQTIAAAPKIIGVFLVIMILSGFFTKILTEYVQDSFDLAFNVIPKQGDFVLPPEGELPSSDFFNEEKNYSSLKRPKISDHMKNPGKVPYSDRKSKYTYSTSHGVPDSEPNLVEKRRMYTGK